MNIVVLEYADSQEYVYSDEIRNFWEYGKTGDSGASDDLPEFHNFDGLVESHDSGKVGDPGKSDYFGDCGDSSESRDSG